MRGFRIKGWDWFGIWQQRGFGKDWFRYTEDGKGWALCGWVRSCRKRMVGWYRLVKDLVDRGSGLVVRFGMTIFFYFISSGLWYSLS